MKDTTKSKIKSSLFWGGLASSILIFAQSITMLFGIEIPQTTVAGIMASVNSFLAILTFSGILVNPNQVDSFQVMMVKKK